MSDFFFVAPVKAYEDPKGAILFPFRDLGVDPSEMKKMHVVSFGPEEVLGNHFHPFHEEYILVSGVEVLVSMLSPDGVDESFILGPEPALVTIAPGVSHAFKNQGEVPGFLTCWYSGGGEEVLTEERDLLD